MYRERLIAFYDRYNPACLDSVDEILEIFEGREEELFRVLAEKYGAQEHFADSQSKRGALFSAGEPARFRGNSGRSELAKLNNVRSSSLCDVCERLREALHAKNEEVRHLVSRVKGMEGRLKQCSAMHVSAAAPEQSGRSKSELAYENRDLSEKLRSCESENANLSARNRELRKEVVVLQAENEALRRQKRMDEDTLEHLRKRICESERKERHLLVTVAARELEAGSPLHEKEFQEIIRSSQQQLTAFYEEKMVAMQAEMDRFYAEASACIQEKDAIIAALKEEEA